MTTGGASAGASTRGTVLGRAQRSWFSFHRGSTEQGKQVSCYKLPASTRWVARVGWRRQMARWTVQTTTASRPQRFLVVPRANSISPGRFSALVYTALVMAMQCSSIPRIVVKLVGQARTGRKAFDVRLAAVALRPVRSFRLCMVLGDSSGRKQASRWKRRSEFKMQQQIN